MKKNALILIALGLFLSACSHKHSNLQDTIQASAKTSHAVSFATDRPVSVDFQTVIRTLENPACDYSAYKLSYGENLSRPCLNAWALNFIDAMYRGRWDTVSEYLDPNGYTPVKAIQKLMPVQGTSRVQLIGNPVIHNQAMDARGSYFWLLELPVTVTASEKGGASSKTAPQLVILVVHRTHTPKTLGLSAMRVRVKPLGAQKLAQEEDEIRTPYLPIKFLYEKPYSALIYLDNPVDAQVNVFKDQALLYSRWTLAGPSSIPTDTFPVGKYLVKVVVSGKDAQFLRTWWLYVDRQ